MVRLDYHLLVGVPAPPRRGANLRFAWANVYIRQEAGELVSFANLWFSEGSEADQLPKPLESKAYSISLTIAL